MDEAEMMRLSSQPSRRPNETPRTPNLQPATEAMEQGFEALRRSTRLKTMWPRLERLCPPRSERLWFIGGQPGNYKTQVMWNLALSLAERRQRVLFVSLEQTTGEMAVAAVARYSQIPLGVLERAQSGEVHLTEQQHAGLMVASQRLAETELFLRLHGADQHGRGLDDVIRSATRQRFDAVFIDHIGMVGRDDGNELEQLSSAIDRLRRLARGSIVKDYRPFVCATTPLKRDAATGDEEKLPAITDFRGSSRLEYDADVAIVLRKRPRKDVEEDCSGPTLVDGFVLKNRQGPCPAVLQFEAQGAICFVSERHKEDQPPQGHWSDR